MKKTSGRFGQSALSTSSMAKTNEASVEPGSDIASEEPSNTQSETKEICAEDIRLVAYLKWEAAGRPDGNDVYYWLEAERECNAAGEE
jgi:hypothetical protein